MLPPHYAPPTVVRTDGWGGGREGDEWLSKRRRAVRPSLSAPCDVRYSSTGSHHDIPSSHDVSYRYGASPAIRITQFYMPSDTGERASALTTARQAGTRFTYPESTEGWVDLGVGYIPRGVHLSTDSHPSKYQLSHSKPTGSWTQDLATVSTSYSSVNSRQHRGQLHHDVRSSHDAWNACTSQGYFYHSASSWTQPKAAEKNVNARNKRACSIRHHSWTITVGLRAASHDLPVLAFISWNGMELFSSPCGGLHPH